MDEITSAPARLDRPKLARFLFERDIAYEAAGRALSRSREWVRFVCLPFSDPRRRVPDKKSMERIVAWTDGEVTPADFYPPELTPRSTVPADGSEA